MFCVFIQYISLLMDWVESMINNEDIFPIDKGTFITKSAADTIITLMSILGRQRGLVYWTCNLEVLEFKSSSLLLELGFFTVLGLSNICLYTLPSFLKM